MMPQGLKRPASTNSKDEASSNHKHHCQVSSNLELPSSSKAASIAADACKNATHDVAGTSSDMRLRQTEPYANRIQFKHSTGSKMHEALQVGNFDHVRSMLDKGEAICWSRKTNCISLAVKHGDMEFVRELIERQPQAVNAIVMKGHILSCCTEQPEIFVSILKKIKDPQQIPMDAVCGQLCQSKVNNKIEILSHLKSIHFKFKLQSLLQYFGSYNKEMIKIILENGLIKKGSKLNATCLLSKCHNFQHFRVARMFLENFLINLNSQINIAAIQNSIDHVSVNLPLVKLYLEHGLINLNLPLEFAAFQNYFENTPPDFQQIYAEHGLAAIHIKEPQDIDSCAQMLAHRNCYSETAKKIIGIFQDCKLPLEDSNGKSLIHYTTDANVHLHLLKLKAEINTEFKDEFLCELVHNHFDIEEICECLNIISGRGIVISAGEEKSLFEYIKHITVLQKLIDLGCRDTVPSDILGKFLDSLFELPMKKVTFIVGELAANGGSKTAKDRNGCSLYCYALRNSRYCSKNDDLRMCKDIISDPVFEDETYSFTCSLNNIRNHLPCDELLPLLFQNKNFKKMTYDNYSMQHIEMQLMFEPCKVSAAATIIDFELRKNSYSSERSYTNKKYFSQHCSCLSVPNNRINKLLAAGLDLKEEIGLSALSLFFIHHQNYEVVVNTLIPRGVNIKSSVLVFRNENLRNLQQQLQVPDLFLLSAITGEMQFVQDYCSHLACSPMCLLAFTEPKYHASEMQMKNLMTTSARVPHGTLVFKSLRCKLQQLDLTMSYYYSGLTKVFDDVHKHPLSLLELSRDALRMSLAQKAADIQTPSSLPEMLASLLPPGLKDEMIRSKIACLIAEQHV